MVDLVIARYKEDLGWLRDVPEHINIIIYNKDDTPPPQKFMTRIGWSTRGSQPTPMNAPSRCKVINLPNIGREADTYLKHIIDNYHELADITVFCQGSPFDHSPDMLKLLHLTHKYAPVQPLTDRYLDISDMPPKNMHDITEDFIEDARVRAYPISFYNFQTLEFHDPGSYDVLEPYMKHFNIPNGTNIIEHAMKTNGFTLKEPVPAVGYFNFAAIFAVSKENILQHQLQAYVNLKEMNARGNALCASAIERMWLYIFGYDKPLVLTNQRTRQPAEPPEPSVEPHGTSEGDPGLAVSEVPDVETMSLLEILPSIIKEIAAASAAMNSIVVDPEPPSYESIYKETTAAPPGTPS